MLQSAALPCPSPCPCWCPCLGLFSEVFAWCVDQRIVEGSSLGCASGFPSTLHQTRVSPRTPPHSHCNSSSVPCEKHSWRGTGCSPARTVRTGRKNAPEAISSCDKCRRTIRGSLIGVSPFRLEPVEEGEDLENDVGEVDDEELRAAGNPKDTLHGYAGTKLVSLAHADAADCV